MKSASLAAPSHFFAVIEHGLQKIAGFFAMIDAAGEAASAVRARKVPSDYSLKVLGINPKAMKEILR